MVWSWLTGGAGGSPPAIVATQQGRVEGFQDKATGVFHFRGIPYAAPPVGARRFRKPEPHPVWEGVRRCKEFGRTAAQGMSIIVLVFLPKPLAALAYGFLWATGMNPLDNHDPKKPHSLPRACSEAECLNLNVETTGFGPEAPKKPVMVFIHGGGFYLGSSSQYLYQPKDSYLARAGVVIVTINYRLGALGFLKVEGGDYNCGIWDQVAALQWVQDNIAAFGGDPGNVTIFGESAGGFSCATLTATRFAGKLFHKAIFQSGAGQTGVTKEDAAALAQGFAEALEIPSCSVESMAPITPAALVATTNKVVKGRRYGMMPLQPVVDGDLLPDRVLECWKRGSAKDLAIMNGYCKGEELFFLKIFPANFVCADEQALLGRITTALSPAQMDVPGHEEAARRVLEEIKGWEGGTRAPEHADYWTFKAVDFGSTLKFAIPAHAAAEALLHNCRSLHLFRFDVHSPLMHGACHVIDLPYVFGVWRTLSGSICPKDDAGNHALCAAVVRAWTNFAYSGDPNIAPEGKPPLAQDTAAADGSKHTLPPWPALTAADPDRVMVLDVPLSASRTQAVPLHAQLPTLWKVCLENARALWFHRPVPSAAVVGKANGNGKDAAAPALQSNL